ncbi:hypothetical protein Tco_0962911 [Tanacetum coccineum]
MRFTTESHEIYMESQEIHIESQEISLESQMIQGESQENSTESHVDFSGILWLFSNLIKDEGKMGTYVENLKKLLDDVKADMPNPPSRDTGDVIEAESLVSTEESLVILHMILYE